jgi:formylglycine-generating enzyme required for sulfatase activity
VVSHVSPHPARNVTRYRTFQEYLTACHLTDHSFPDDLADLLRADPQRWREAVLLAGAKAARGMATGAWLLAEALCFRDPPVGEGLCAQVDCWGALLATQTLLENERERLDQVSERNAPKLERVRRWLLVMVTWSQLPLVDRALSGQALAVFGDDRDFDELVRVLAGPFLMGEGREQHELKLSAFQIGRYPATNAQYLRFVEMDGYRNADFWREAIRTGFWRDGQFKGSWDDEPRDRPFDYGEPYSLPNHLVLGITWYEALAYCRWLTEVWRKESKIAPDEAVRLPTEAEWEKAACGPSIDPSASSGRGTDGRRYPWGDEFNPAGCNMSDIGIGTTSVVGMFPDGASPYGCLDMAGNVLEWTNSLWGADWEKPEFKYPYDPDEGRGDLEASDRVLRVLRGGAFFSDARLVRCAYRSWYYPHFRDHDVGFRVVVAPGF